jgi:Holliday junction resolvase RusA-like endonuclease
MEIVGWRGKVVSANRRLVPGKGKARWVGNPEYKSFLESLAYQIRGYTRKRYKTCDLLLSFELSRQIDHHNLLKPICDAIEAAGVVKNDRDIGNILLMKPVRHKNGEDDYIQIHITGEER